MPYISVYAIKHCYGNLPDMVRQREKLTVTVPQELIDWLNEMVEKRAFASRSHGVELCIMEYRNRRQPGTEKT